MESALKSLVSGGPRSPAARVGAWWALDGLGAIGFAGGLGAALSRAPRFDAVAVAALAALPLAMIVRGEASRRAQAAGAARAAALKAFVRSRVLGAVMAAPPSEAAPLGERLAAVVDEVEALGGFYARFEPLAFAARVTPLLVIAAAALASPVSAGIMAFTLLPFAALMILAGSAASEAASLQFSALARLSGLFIDRVRALPLVLSFQGEARETARVRSAAEDVAARTLGVLRIAFVSSAGLEFFAALAVALVAVYAGFNLLGLLPFPAPERLDLGRAVFVLALAPEVYTPWRRLAAAYHDRQSAEAAAERLARVLARERPLPDPSLQSGEPPEVRFERAVIRYPEGAEIGPVDFTAPAGRITVLLGASGSGKSSILALLAGAAPLSAGEVRVGPDRLSETGSFAPLIGWAGQSPVLAPGDVASNIALGRPGACATAIEAAARRVGLGPLIASRPEGLSTVLDERGAGLSGGERRRIGLARAALKNAPLLCLDEPTADLDLASEEALVATLRSLARGRTVLIATHSEKVAALADCLVRLA